MQPLIDGDILCYEIGYAAETGWKKSEGGKPPFDYVAKLLDLRILEICEAVGATKPPLVYLTGEGNFRERIAITKPYKGNRSGKKPFHYRNIYVYLKAVYDAEEVGGIEADDRMSIEQYGRLDSKDTIICTRDKDLRMVPGWHYGWELGRQPRYGPHWVEETGSLELVKGQVKGTGLAFFYAQTIMGDSVDNIPGIAGKGPVYAFNTLKGCETPEEMLKAVRQAYWKKYGERGDEMLLEQGQLLWMVRELDEEGKPVMWRF